MAPFIEVLTTPASQFVDDISRYHNSEVIYWSEKKYITFKTYKKKPLVFSPDDRYMIIPKEFEYRPDKLAQELYNDVRYWWKILEANNIKDILDFKYGRNIRIPSSIF
jgi:hypothetical protein